MVKITNLHDEEKAETTNPPEEEIGLNELTPQEIKDITEKHTKDLNPFITVGAEAKTEKINTRITETISNTLKVYCELNNTTVSNFIDDLISNFFEGKKINRDYYPIEETVIAIPKTPKLIKKYIENEVNLVVNKSEITKSFPIDPYDKQYSLCKSNQPLINLFYMNGTNNYLDKLDPKNKVYYSTINKDVYSDDVFKQFEEELEPKDLLKTHSGLIIFPMTYLKEYNKEKKYYEEKPLKKDYCMFLLVHEYNNKITRVNLITRKQAINLALTVENEDLLEYINNNEDIATFKPIKEEYELIDFQSEHITELKQKIEVLEEENRKLKEYNKSKDILQDKEEASPVKSAPEEVMKTINYIALKEKELNTITKLLEKYTKDISKDITKYEEILEEINKK